MGKHSAQFRKPASQEEKELAKKFGSNMANKRAALDITQIQLGRHFRKSGQFIWEFEQGRRFPRPAFLSRLAKVLQCEPQDLLPTQCVEEIIEVCNCLSEDKQKALLEYAHVLERQQKTAAE